MGRISLLIGCMFAQKTTELIRRVRRYTSIGYKVLLVNFIGDVRYGDNCVASHDKDIEKAVCVPLLRDIDHMVQSGYYNVIAIDEGQFFPDLFEYITSWADRLSVHIVIAGLDGTYDREPFGDIIRLIPHAEEVERLSAMCAVCRDGTVAVYSKYIGINSDHQEHLIGGADLYKPVCRKHFLHST